MNWDDLPTGHVMTEGDPVKWFVMVKDTKGRFPENPNWGDGWGGAFFSPTSSKRNISRDYKTDCFICHDSARDSDMVFLKGYRVLRKE